MEEFNMKRGTDGYYHFLYRTTNLINDRFYIGIHSTRILEDGYLGSGKRLQFEIKKYGKENFKREILEYFENRKTLLEKEEQIVNITLLNNPLILNLAKGGGKIDYSLITDEIKKKISLSRIGKKLSEETKHKISNSISGKNHWNYGNKISEKLRNIFSFVNKGKILSEETKQKISIANSGKTRTEETKQKISESQRGKSLTEEHKRKIIEGKTKNKTYNEIKPKIEKSRSRFGETNNFYGKHHSFETKQKISDSLRGKPRNISEEGLKRFNQAKFKKVVINGILFLSVGDALKNLEYSKRALYKKLKDETDINTYYLQRK